MGSWGGLLDLSLAASSRREVSTLAASSKMAILGVNLFGGADPCSPSSFPAPADPQSSLTVWNSLLPPHLDAVHHGWWSPFDLMPLIRDVTAWVSKCSGQGYARLTFLKISHFRLLKKGTKQCGIFAWLSWRPSTGRHLLPFMNANVA